MFIYDMPFLERKKLCSILDRNNCFEELAAVHMQFDSETVQKISREFFRGISPTEKLLDLWSHHNHTVFELFILLYRMKHYQAMTILKPLVDSKYHHLIKQSTCLPELMADLKLEQEPITSEKILNAPSCENNETKPQKPNGISLISCVTESVGAVPQIPYDDLRQSTNDWNTGSILGRGGFGTVFKGVWKCTQVAIKRIEKKADDNSDQIFQSYTELHCLNAYRHDNILPLYGYSIDGPQHCLVYQYMSGGSLEHRLHIRDASRVLSWPTRLTIAIGTARGLQFLHTIRDKPLIHGDIKSANILLDLNEIPRIGDFGLAREGPPQTDYVKVSRIHGTRPYLPDEFMKYKKFSTKVDTYSFGVVLFELATAGAAYSNKRVNKFLRDHVVFWEGDVLQLKDSRAEGGEDFFKGLVEVGKGCVRTGAKDRPEMVTVLLQLEAVMNQ
ncbi:serine/threonine-protein kinase pelle [Tribolium castaneum]|uniref:non-specific serine/threonine protein kinase n=1 Tax=Tribolium castaneum TaxID=7070 RepID=D2A4G0_TRICA|nr:PREDICTED: serine/threonine-protein kinase pelle isoform X2 [Tribolium castaneum]EFA05720.1 pelle [Tribolium castaneum]|eukprot:XP_966383.1 PREDICTED: serine/threonine-protein kinase pelle isoform X2 [Tribolium castaneum]